MRENTPAQRGFTMPAEWEHHEAVWLAWPSAADLWLEDLEAAQAEFTAFCEAIADTQGTTFKGERMNVLVPDIEAGSAAEQRLRHLPVQIHLIPFGDIWLRDTAPLFLVNKNGEGATVQFRFNGWGGKYALPFDAEVAENIAGTAGLTRFQEDWILEGGSVEVDGEGTILTSRQCLLNANRNAGLSIAAIESLLKSSLGGEKVLWLNDGLLNDHTDGHIDTMARFVAPGKVVCMKADDPADPNREILAKIEADLRKMTDARGRRLEVVTVPSPGAVLNEDGDLMPASYLNFYIANSTVIVPTYGSPRDEAAVRAIATHFPGRRTIGSAAKAILTGGGAFHCISQQQPSVRT
jgi:agmatine deiminase